MSSTLTSNIEETNELNAELYILNERCSDIQKQKKNGELMVNELKLQLDKIKLVLKSKENETFFLKKELNSTKETYELIKSRQVSFLFNFKTIKQNFNFLND